MSLSSLFGSKPKHAIALTVDIGGHPIDGYQVCDTGEFRAGMEGASLFVGYEKSWVSQMVRKETKTLEALRAIGFNAGIESLAIDGDRGRQNPKTIDLNDLAALIEYAAYEAKKPKAIEVTRGLIRVSLYRYFDATFYGRVGELAEMNRLFENAKIRPAFQGGLKRLTTDIGYPENADDHDYLNN
jgi:hypothetical protein